MSERGDVLWRPSPDARERTRLGQYLDRLAAERGLSFDAYEDLWRWSVTDLDAFWRSVWDHFGLSSATPVGGALPADGRAMPGARWFPGVTLNYAEHALRGPAEGAPAGGDLALVARS
ncbi:MAG TPA: acetyl-coenzyme A synthetase N-terminal domain-containing protein, partial [Acidimicrobiales bacterium]|nr:acetyl-coenzyme A synthetase N-terminal domain-containing protein [Acidimicrobiales bacterium]